jgi:hypothetical protein
MAVFVRGHRPWPYLNVTGNGITAPWADLRVTRNVARAPPWSENRGKSILASLVGAMAPACCFRGGMLEVMHQHNALATLLQLGQPSGVTVLGLI